MQITKHLGDLLRKHGEAAIHEVDQLADDGDGRALMINLLISSNDALRLRIQALEARLDKLEGRNNARCH
ncbi:hypothetical protein [Halomonas sp. H5]|uniref:hypothetical protein n=1 Tax=Halomonas sp. H5 TaxID=3423910 RepID=UPI003D367358